MLQFTPTRFYKSELRTRILNFAIMFFSRFCLMPFAIMAMFFFLILLYAFYILFVFQPSYL